jgi:hypothetical protein
MKRWLSLLILFPLVATAQQSEAYSIHGLKTGKFKDDSSYIYTLPFNNRKKVFLVQGYESSFSHKNERALDFKIK